jgi:hypothetical protein
LAGGMPSPGVIGTYITAFAIPVEQSSNQRSIFPMIFTKRIRLSPTPRKNW